MRSRCRRQTRVSRPPSVPRQPFGRRLTTVVVSPSVRYRLSGREVRQALQDFCGVRLSLGKVAGAPGVGSARCSGRAVAEARPEVWRVDLVNLDDMGWRHDGQRAWSGRPCGSAEAVPGRTANRVVGFRSGCRRW